MEREVASIILDLGFVPVSSVDEGKEDAVGGRVISHGKLRYRWHRHRAKTHLVAGSVARAMAAFHPLASSCRFTDAASSLPGPPVMPVIPVTPVLADVIVWWSDPTDSMFA